MSALLASYKVALWVAKTKENINNAKDLNEILQQMCSLGNVQRLLQKKVIQVLRFDDTPYLNIFRY